MAYGYLKHLSDGQHLIKYYVRKHSIQLKVQNMMDIKQVFLQQLANILIENLLGLILQVVFLKLRLCKTKNYLNNYANQLLENLKDKKYTPL